MDWVRKYAKEISLLEAVECAITECIREGTLKEFLEKNRAEVKKMSIYEYDQEKHIRMERQEAWEDGVLRGAEQQLNKIIKNMMKKGRSISQIAEKLGEEEDRVRELAKKLIE